MGRRGVPFEAGFPTERLCYQLWDPHNSNFMFGMDEAMCFVDHADREIMLLSFMSQTAHGWISRASASGSVSRFRRRISSS